MPNGLTLIPGETPTNSGEIHDHTSRRFNDVLNYMRNLNLYVVGMSRESLGSDVIAHAKTVKVSIALQSSLP